MEPISITNVIKTLIWHLLLFFFFFPSDLAPPAVFKTKCRSALIGWISACFAFWLLEEIGISHNVPNEGGAKIRSLYRIPSVWSLLVNALNEKPVSKTQRYEIFLSSNHHLVLCALFFPFWVITVLCSLLLSPTPPPKLNPLPFLNLTHLQSPFGVSPPALSDVWAQRGDCWGIEEVGASRVSWGQILEDIWKAQALGLHSIINENSVSLRIASNREYRIKKNKRPKD